MALGKHDAYMVKGDRKETEMILVSGDMPSENLRIQLISDGEPETLDNIQRAKLHLYMWESKVYERILQVDDEEDGIVYYEWRRKDTRIEPGRYKMKVKAKFNDKSEKTFPNQDSMIMRVEE